MATAESPWAAVASLTYLQQQEYTLDEVMRKMLISGYTREVMKEMNVVIPTEIVKILLYYYPYIVKLEYILQEAKLKKIDYEHRFSKGMYPYNEIFVQMDILYDDKKRKRSLNLLNKCYDLETYLNSQIQTKLVIKLLNEIDSSKNGIVDVQGLTYFLNFIFVQYARNKQLGLQSMPIEHFAMWISREYGVDNKNKSNQQYIKTSSDINDGMVNQNLVLCFWQKDIYLCFDNFRENLYEWKQKYLRSDGRVDWY